MKKNSTATIPVEHRGHPWNLDGTRQCSRCERWLEPGEFRPNLKMKDGLNSWCRSCMVASTREWRAKHRATILEKRRRRWAERRDELNAAARARYAEHRSKP